MLERYPPKDPQLAPRAPRPVVVAAPSPVGSEAVHPSTPATTTPEPSSEPAGPPPVPLITLDRGFDLDEFASLLGETSIRVTVPRADLPEVLRRVTDFMGFGIYVYAISVRPSSAELLKSFVVELQRVDYSAEKGAWLPFVEKGVGSSPYEAGDRPG